MNKEKKFVITLIFAFATIITLIFIILSNSSCKLLSVAPVDVSRSKRNFSVPENINVSALINIQTKEDVLVSRDKLIKLIWPNSSMPTGVPRKIPEKDFVVENSQGISRMETWEYEMPYGFKSTMHYFVPNKPSNKLVIFHQGHTENEEEPRILYYFFKKNFAVVRLSMPLEGPNEAVLVNLPRLGPIMIKNHDDLRLLESDSFSPLSLFIEPVIAVVNYMENKYSEIYLTGLSGGGWTTVVVAAIDERINRSYPVAGSYPLFLRSSSEMGDYEQSHPALLNIANYLELYILGSCGKSRKQIQIVNTNDPCCFESDRYKIYEGVIKQKLIELECGEFVVFEDDSHSKHTISDAALAHIVDDINSPLFSIPKKE